MRSRRPARLPTVLRWLALPVVAAGIAFAWWTISPLFITSRVDEAFPVAAPSTAMAPATPAAAASIPVASVTPPAHAGAEASVSPAVPPTARASVTPSAPPAAAPSALPAPSATNAPVTEPIVLARGSFTRVDALHSAEGTATIYALPDGSRVLRLESFRAQNGPDLYVSLSGHPMPRTNAETFDSGYVELERLKANEGNQNYALPADLDLSAFNSVVIWCKAFSVVFSTAELMPG